LVGGYGASQHLNFSLTWLRDRLLEASVRSSAVLPSQLAWFLSSRFSLVLHSFSAGLRRGGRRRDSSSTTWYGPSDLKGAKQISDGPVLFVSAFVVACHKSSPHLYQTLGERFLYLRQFFLSVMALSGGDSDPHRRLLFSILICVLAFIR